ncbi:MAG: hypothetical protein LBJ00_00535 [Planctomycetaceae bacterium]|nr:hypothetical protein [Planctomycetaceae bacterium]
MSLRDKNRRGNACGCPKNKGDSKRRPYAWKNRSSGAKPIALPATVYTQAVLKFLKLDTQAQQREAVVQGRSLSPIPASV